MKTQEEIHNLIQSFQTVTKALASATVAEDSYDKVLVAMLLIPLLPALDDFMDVLKAETQATEASVKEDPLDKILRQIKPDGTLS